MWWLQSLHRQQYGAAGFNLSATNCADLKPENFLLKNRTGSIEKDNLRAVDFGLSSIHRDGMICKQIVGSGESFALSRLHGLDCLTANSNGAQHSGPTAQLRVGLAQLLAAYYLAPEVLKVSVCQRLVCSSCFSFSLAPWHL